MCDKIGQLSAAKLRDRNQQTSFFFFFVRVKRLLAAAFKREKSPRDARPGERNNTSKLLQRAPLLECVSHEVQEVPFTTCLIFDERRSRRPSGGPGGAF